MQLYSSLRDNILFVGDIHGEFHNLMNRIKEYEIRNATVIVCGDIGMGFMSDLWYEKIFVDMDETLSDLDIDLFMFRGNHDDKTFFDGKHFDGFTNIHFIPDYSVIRTALYNILCVGGAISIDRYQRVEGKSYWANEINVFDEEKLDELKRSNINVDIVCTHSAPSFCKPNTTHGISYWFTKDDKLEQDVNLERMVCDKILEKLRKDGHPIKQWCYGHFHDSNTEYFDGIKFVMLNILEFINLYY